MDLINREIALIDRENAFLLFATFCGDVERTAGALNISGAAVVKMADDEGWLSKLTGIIELKKSKKPGDLERAISRAINFVQAHRYRMFLERVLQRLAGFTEAEFKEYLLTKATKEGTVSALSTRALADLASALEKCHAMTYLALNDTAQERIKRNETADNTTSGGELHVQIARAMADVRASQTPRAQLFDAQLAIAADVAKTARKETPLDNDNH
jgi:hypothetical protein